MPELLAILLVYRLRARMRRAQPPGRASCGERHIEVRICHSSGKNLSSSALAR